MPHRHIEPDCAPLRLQCDQYPDAASHRRRVRSPFRRHRACRAQTVPFVFNVPHAGAVYPAAFLAASRLDAMALRRSEDAFVDELFAARGRTSARRSWRPASRAPFSTSTGSPTSSTPRMFDGRLPPFANTRSMRVAGGLGTIPRIVADGQEIYRGRLPVDEALRRIEWLYKPYHRDAAPARAPHGPGLRPRRPDRLPFHALDERQPRGRRQGRHRARRPLRHELRHRAHRSRRGGPARAAAIRWSATSPMRAASSPSITASRRSAAMRCRSRSTARSTWTSAALQKKPASPTLRRTDLSSPSCRSVDGDRTRPIAAE